MQAIILAAGEGTRMRPLTWTCAKPLLKVAGKSILERTLENLEEAGCRNAIVIVGYKAEQFREKLGDRHGNVSISYAVQDAQKGTGDALLVAEKLAEERFLVLYGDDYYSAEDLRACAGAGPSIAAKEHPEPQRFGVIAEKGGRLTDIVEKPNQPPSNFVNTGLYQLDRRIFGELRASKLSVRGEIELTDAVRSLAKKAEIKVVAIKDWTPIGYPWDLLTISEKLVKSEVTETEIDGSAEVSERATIVGPVRVGAGTKLKSGVHIEGPVIIGKNCNIGPNCFIRAGAVIGNGVNIGNAVEVKNSTIGDRTHVSHLSYIGDSVIGSDCNLAAGTITANLRHDNRSVRVPIKGQLVDTCRRKFGVVMGDRSKTGIHNSIYPGAMVGPFSWAVPNISITGTVEPFKLWDGKEQLELEPVKFEALVKEPVEFKALQELYARTQGGK